MNKVLSRSLSLALAFLMVLTLLPLTYLEASALSENSASETPQDSQELTSHTTTAPPAAEQPPVITDTPVTTAPETDATALSAEPSSQGQAELLAAETNESKTLALEATGQAGEVKPFGYGDDEGNIVPITITLQYPDGTRIDSFEIPAGDNLEAIPNGMVIVVPKGYVVFEGWQLNGSDVVFPIENVQTDLTLVAKFSNQYTISYAQDVNGERTVIHTEKVTVGQAIQEPPASILDKLDIGAGDHFAYWCAEGSATAFAFGSTSATGNLVLLPSFSTTCLVMFISAGTQVDPQYPQNGTPAIAPTNPTRIGYTFSYWSKNPEATVATRATDEFDFSTPITTATLLYAVWQAEAVSYTVVYWVEKPNGSWGINDPGTNPAHYDYFGSTHIPMNTPGLIFAADSSITGFTQAQLNLLDASHLKYPTYTGQQDSTKTKSYSYVYSTPDKVRVVSDPLKGDGSSIVNIYLQRKVYTFQFDLAGNKTSVNGRDYTTDPPSPALSTATFTADKGGGTSYSYQGKLGQIMPDGWPQHAQVNSGSTTYRLYGWFIGNYQRTPHNAAGEVQIWMAEAAEVGTNLTVMIAPEWTNDAGIIPVNRLYYVEATPVEAAAAGSVWEFVAGANGAEESFDGTARPYISYNGTIYKLYEAQSGMQNSHESAQRVIIAGTVPAYSYGNNGAQTQVVSGLGADKLTVAYSTNAQNRGLKHIVSTTTSDTAENCYFMYNRSSYQLQFNLQHAPNVGAPISIASVSGIKYGATLTGYEPSSDPQWDGYVFAGWYLDAACTEGREFDFDSTMPNGNLGIFAKWLRDDYRVLFMDGATKLVSQPVGVGQLVDFSDANAAIDQIGGKGDFAGWYWYVGGSFTPFVNHPINANGTTLYARWKTTDLTVSYDAGLGSGSIPVDNARYKVNQDAIVLPAGDGLVPPEGEFFYAWKVQGDATNKLYFRGMTVTVDKSKTLVAQYAHQSLLKEIVYHPFIDDATPQQDVSFYIWPGTSFVLQPALFSHDTYTQIGWTELSTAAGQTTPPEFDFGESFNTPDNRETLHLYAVWSANTDVAVTYYQNASETDTISYVDPGKTFASDYTVLGNETTGFVKTGYTFAGWNTVADGSGTRYAPDDALAKLGYGVELFAQWTVVEIPPVPYRIDHWAVDLDGVPTGILLSQSLSGFVGSQVMASAFTFAGYTFDPVYVGTVLSGDIIGDGSLVLQLYYQANTPIVPPIDPPIDPPIVTPPPVVPFAPAPVAPVGEVPAVVIPAVVTPTAPAPTTPTPPATPAPDLATPLASGPDAHWALLNLILTVVGILLFLVMLIAFFVCHKKEDEDEQGNTETKTKRLGWRVMIGVAAVIAAIVFLLTEDITLPMGWVDWWTIAHVVIFLVQIIFVALATSKKRETDKPRGTYGNQAIASAE